jgi:phosphoenolpyruvate synthase/pyruvate phosphate dikinase
MAEQLVYFFGNGAAEGTGAMKDVLGGKGAGLAEMTSLGLPVPPGFTITTAVCREYYALGEKFPPQLLSEVESNLKRVEEQMGLTFGDPEKPLLVSVRSGARVSMPGMMDTVLNLGLNDQVAEGIAKRANPRFAYDSYRRFVQMYSKVVLEMDSEIFEEMIDEVKERLDITQDVDIPADTWKELVGEFKKKVKEKLGKDFPTDPKEQLWGAIGAVFRSWRNDRAVKYREIYHIPDDWGTAVNVQSMVFGNLGSDCATGVAFTRDPNTGEKRFFGEWLENAQGEDVVAGIRTPNPIDSVGKGNSMEEKMPEVYQELRRVEQRLEGYFKEMQDLEFTIQNHKLYMLQCRTGKRTAKVKEGLIDQKMAINRVSAEQLEQLLHPMIDPKAKIDVIARGLAASPGAASGRVVFSADEAEAKAKAGERVILVRVETSPEDIHGMNAAQGILTARGGLTCVAGDTQILTDQGMLTAEDAFKILDAGKNLRILSFDTRSMKPVWRNIIAAGYKPSEVITVAVSQTGQAEGNHLRLTADHKMYTLQNRRLEKKRLDAVLKDEDFALLVGEIPALNETQTPPSLAYVVGALFSDGSIQVRETKGRVQFIQKPTPEKADFIAAVERCFEQSFGYTFTYVKERETHSVLRGREIHGSVEDRICSRKEPAQRLQEIKDNFVTWVMSLDRVALLHFLAGYADGDGSYAEESSQVRLAITVDAKKPHFIQALVLACLRLGIVPQVTNNRDARVIQITERVEDILAFTQRIKAEIPPRKMESRCLTVKGLFGDIVDSVNFMGRTREGIKRNIMFGTEKIRRDILPLCPGASQRELQTILDSSLRSYRIKQTEAAPEPTTVYNFEVDATDELDKNYIVFSSRMSPILISNSHAAVVARGMGKCCVAGSSEINVDYQKKLFTTQSGHTIKEGDFISLDGAKGLVMLGDVPRIVPELGEDFNTFMVWVDATRRLKVRANADTPRDAKVARAFGAEGIGLCRTEHMFFDEDRIDAVREMILAEDEAGRKKALEKIIPMQRGDFEGLFREMKGLPVTIRLLDPPLHEFLPHTKEEFEDLSKKIGVPKEKLERASIKLSEANPMLGHRGCRLGITFPEIYDAQVRAIAEAAVKLVKEEGFTIIPEIMIPLVATEKELEILRKSTIAVFEGITKAAGVTIEYLVGTMIELPRAALCADTIARQADFFSFGTNDLTQTTIGLSRDDAGKFLGAYREKNIFARDPFVSLDQEGVGQLVKMGVEKGRSTKANLKCGICGEHGGDPESIGFCHRTGLDYVSCSPFRVPVARLAAAQAALKK